MPGRVMPIAIAAYLGKKDRFEQAIADFSVRYADQNERDYDAFCAAISSGRHRGASKVSDPADHPVGVIPIAGDRRSVRALQPARGQDMYWIGGGILYLVLIVTLGVMSLRKGHWVMFIIGLVLPFFWLIGALIPPVRQ